MPGKDTALVCLQSSCFKQQVILEHCRRQMSIAWIIARFDVRRLGTIELLQRLLFDYFCYILPNFRVIGARYGFNVRSDYDASANCVQPAFD